MAKQKSKFPAASKRPSKSLDSRSPASRQQATPLKVLRDGRRQTIKHLTSGNELLHYVQVEYGLTDGQMRAVEAVIGLDLAMADEAGQLEKYVRDYLAAATAPIQEQLSEIDTAVLTKRQFSARVRKFTREILSPTDDSADAASVSVKDLKEQQKLELHEAMVRNVFGCAKPSLDKLNDLLQEMHSKSAKSNAVPSLDEKRATTEAINHFKPADCLGFKLYYEGKECSLSTKRTGKRGKGHYRLRSIGSGQVELYAGPVFPLVEARKL